MPNIGSNIIYATANRGKNSNFEMRFDYATNNYGNEGPEIKEKDLEKYVNKHFKYLLTDNAMTYRYWEKSYGEMVPMFNDNETSPIQINIPRVFAKYPDMLYMTLDHELYHAKDWASGVILKLARTYQKNPDFARNIYEYRAYMHSQRVSNKIFKGIYNFSPQIDWFYKRLPKDYKK